MKIRDLLRPEAIARTGGRFPRVMRLAVISAEEKLALIECFHALTGSFQQVISPMQKTPCIVALNRATKQGDKKFLSGAVGLPRGLSSDFPRIATFKGIFKQNL